MSFGIVETLKCSTLNYQKGSRTKVKLHLNSHFYSIQKLTLAKFFSSFFLFLYFACSLFSVQGGSFFSALWFLVLVVCTLNGLAWFSIFFYSAHSLIFYTFIPNPKEHQKRPNESWPAIIIIKMYVVCKPDSIH